MIKHKLFTLLVALCATTALWAGNVITYTATEKLEETTDAGSAGLHTNAFDVSISSHTFSNGVGTVTFAGEVTRIGDHAFYNCNSLTSITIPNSVTTIGSEAFKYCDGLKTVYNNSNLYITKGSTYNGYVAYYADKVYNGVLIGDFVIKQDTLLTKYLGKGGEVTIPNSVTTIGDAAFKGCSGLTSVTIGNFVTTIGKEAFIGCSGLTSVTIPNSVTTIGDEAFGYCSGLTSIDVDAANTHYASVDGVLFNYTKDILIQYPIGNTRTEYTIPNSVTTIGKYAFHECSGLTSVTIPNSVTTIGEWAFGYCDGLTSITCEATTPPTCGVRCFYYVDKSIPLYVPAGSIEAYQAADQWKEFTNIQPQRLGICGNNLSWQYKNSILTIEGSGDMYDYTNSTIPWAFLQDSIKQIILSTEMTSIGEYAFYNCSKLMALSIPNSVTTIGNHAFYGCNKMTNLIFCSNLTTIGDNAFANCNRIDTMTIYAIEPPVITETTFKNVSRYAFLYVPLSSERKYKTDAFWSYFDIRSITAEEVEVTEIEADPTESAVEIAWPSVVNAETYTIEIRLGDQLICSIVFNAEGQLVSINFNLAPGRGGHTYATTAESTATGWAYTIAGLNPGTNYAYSVTAKDASEQVIDTKSGSFTTQGLPTSIDNMGNNFNNSSVNPTKSLRNGQVIIRKNNKTYNVVGQEVR